MGGFRLYRHVWRTANRILNLRNAKQLQVPVLSLFDRLGVLSLGLGVLDFGVGVWGSE